MRLAGFKDASLVDGEGVRTVIFFTGCPHFCDGCQNPEMQDYQHGKEYTNEEVIKHLIEQSDYLDGITLSGGDPLFQLNATSSLLEDIKKNSILKKLNIWLYTGYLFENIPKKIIKNVDVIIDGKYDNWKKPAKWRGSCNQRIFVKYPGTNKFIQRFYENEYQRNVRESTETEIVKDEGRRA